MELRHLSYFVAVAEEGSFNRAAARLLLSQPSLSRQIRDLERELGKTLLERSAQGVAPTPAGVALLAHGRRLLQLATATRRVVADTAAPGEVVLGVPPTVSGEWFLAVVEALRTRPLPVSLRVSEAYSVEQIRLLRDGRIDIGLVSQRPSGEVQSVMLSEHLYGLALHPAHPLRERSVLRMDDLAGLRILVRDRQQVPADHDLALREVESAGIAVQWEITRFTEHARACATAADADAVFCGEFTARRVLPDWHWRPLNDLRTTMSLWLVWHRLARDDVHDVAAAMCALDLIQEAAQWSNLSPEGGSPDSRAPQSAQSRSDT